MTCLARSKEIVVDEAIETFAREIGGFVQLPTFNDVNKCGKTV